MPSSGGSARKPSGNALGKAAASAEVLEAMQAYAGAHQVDEMLRVLLRRLLEEQPLDPIDFLVKTARDCAALDALERRCAAQRFDLRRERTKKALVRSVFQRLLALQSRKDREADADADAVNGRLLGRGFLLEQLQADDTRAHLRELFPRHYRDLLRRLKSNEKQLPLDVDADSFAAVCLQVLATKASAS